MKTDCGTLRGLAETALKNNEEVVESLYDRILGRVSLTRYLPSVNRRINHSIGSEITEEIAISLRSHQLKWLKSVQCTDLRIEDRCMC
jgi:DNA-directed RNA polymerase subunit beta'